ncbi:D-2-hydroxyacid dehydrogenase family protein [Erwiniaceae bacterium BAC15a-03b]|uniref:D-2-hydroxyacid dehydrogenase family protein n=1 Tax=Winslowiella arboricola TaxID=2978220 RepID=A0A9J6Q0I2_9GAMM|nr:D-2-hydroxyacid dehydrogenase family protein [Winslowiella arboricola]MCU5772888.1 D-2-hydroxyacid dehydrogenase family protein [Winslowiella arboricola]MCU5780684.1 D-2-hydroxyacid dehydrogenase family protein [Winslowiella arboricola]
MSQIKCVILDDYQHVALSLANWHSISDRVSVVAFTDHLSDRAQLTARLKDAAIVIVMRERTPIDRQLLDQLPDLKLLITSGMRNAAIDLTAAREKGVTVCGTASAADAPLELTWALTLGLARHLVTENNAFTRGGVWQQTVGTTLAGKRLGIIGLGKIGSRVATIAQAFGMQVCAWSPNLTPARAEAAGVEFCAQKNTLLAQSDFVTLHMVLSEQSARLIDSADFAAMKASAYLINTSRAGLIAPGTLVNALKNQQIAGAGIDVFEQEPVAVDDEYRQLPNLLATPHLGYVSDSNYQRYFTEALENIRAWLDQQPIREIT